MMCFKIETIFYTSTVHLELWTGCAFNNEVTKILRHGLEMEDSHETQEHDCTL